MKNAEKMYDTFQLGEDARCTLSMDTHATQCNNNILVVGGTGSGKTMGVANQMLFQLQYGNAVGVFTKRGMTEDLGKILQSRGYHVYTMDLTQPEKSAFGYDPLHYCRTDADVIALANAIIHAEDKKNDLYDPFWKDSATQILAPVLRYVQSGRYKKGRTMMCALELLNSIPCCDWDHADYRTYSFTDLYKHYKEDGRDWKHNPRIPTMEAQLIRFELPKLKKMDPAGGMFWDSFANGASQTRSSIQQSLMAPISKIFAPDIQKLLKAKKMFDFRTLLQPKTVLFVYTSPVNPAFHSFMSIFYLQLFKALFELAEARKDHVLPHPVYILCDDFATGCHVPNFPEMISVFREKQISATLLIQSESQLAGIYGIDDAKTIINNCDTYIYLGGMDIDTSKSIAARLNRPYPDVLAMPIAHEYFFHRGQRPVSTKRKSLYDDAAYLAAYRAVEYRLCQRFVHGG